MFGTYRKEDVTILLKDITGLVKPLGTQEREARIQQGTHYSEMLPLEYEPSGRPVALCGPDGPGGGLGGGADLGAKGAGSGTGFAGAGGHIRGRIAETLFPTLLRRRRAALYHFDHPWPGN